MSHRERDAIITAYSFARSVAEVLETRKETLARAMRSAVDDDARARVTQQQADLEHLRALAAQVGITGAAPGPYGLSTGRYVTLCELAWRVSPGTEDSRLRGLAWPSTETIADHTGQGTRGVEKAIAYLVEHGYVVQTTTTDGHRAWRVIDRAAAWWAMVRGSEFLPLYAALLSELRSKRRLPAELDGWDVTPVVVDPALVGTDDELAGETAPDLVADVDDPEPAVGTVVPFPVQEADPADTTDIGDDDAWARAQELARERTRAAWIARGGAA